jgi:hypothetical protein
MSTFSRRFAREWLWFIGCLLAAVLIVPLSMWMQYRTRAARYAETVRVWDAWYSDFQVRADKEVPPPRDAAGRGRLTLKELEGFGIYADSPEQPGAPPSFRAGSSVLRAAMIGSLAYALACVVRLSLWSVQVLKKK